MKLTRQQETNVLQVYNAYWNNYLKGDLEAIHPLLDIDYTQVGSAEGEVFFNKKDAVQFLYDTIDQVAGKLQMRNRVTKLEPQDNIILIHEQWDLYALANNDWIFYSKVRTSTLMQEKKDGWKITHQHSSFPDSRARNGKNVVIDKIAEENLQLREAVKRCTMELEHKNRELEIEAALERVRARTMAMQKSDELAEVAVLLFKQVSELKIKTWTAGFNVWSVDGNSYTDYITSPQGNMIKAYTIDVSEFPVFREVRDARNRGDKFWIQFIEGELLKETYRELSKFGIEKQYEKMLEDGFQFPSSQYVHFVFGSQVSLMFITYEPIPEAHDIFIRFGIVFEQTYTRFLDLQKAEEQAKETIKASSFDRVRAEIASMRTVDDLQQITPLIWKELIALEVPFVRCGVFIIDESSAHVQVYLSSPEGHSLATLELPFDSSELILNIVNNWRIALLFKTHWYKEDFINWMQTMIMEGHIQNRETYPGALQLPESLDLHFVPFKQGMLYVGNISPLKQDELQLVKSLAESFSIAYARYEDFQQLEDAKNQIEKTLTELKATQSQLIQAEKMASLGELTAGIAHEIQNPLNFVNNFSEVNKELLAEMNQEIEKGNLAEIKALVNDVIENEEKILHHGKRADGIVKGMLQHSRSSSGLKEPTDINKLADEYLRLAYHGFRAKDKSFNATLKTDFDQSIRTINVIPQDIGRAVLNLITNAFYAVAEKKRQQTNGYEPTVSVSTKKVGDKIIISVKDNGNGIPQKVMDKIFQPFFTTKPTGQGTGLGLSMSYDIVKAHAGELKVDSKEGEGAEFTMILPV